MRASTANGLAAFQADDGLVVEDELSSSMALCSSADLSRRSLSAACKAGL